MIDNIIGKLYPVKNFNHEICAYMPITKYTLLINIAGIVISVNEKDPDIFIGINEAIDLITNEKEIILLAESFKELK